MLPDPCITDPPHSAAVPGGLRLTVLAAVVAAPSIGVTFAMIIAPGTVGTIIFAICKVVMLALPVIWFLGVERQSPSLSPVRKGGIGMGIALGLLISIVIWGIYGVLGERLIDAEHVRAMATQNGIGTTTRYLAAAAYWITINSLLEEYVYRWFIFKQASHFAGARMAVLVSAIAFTIHHVVALKMQFGWDVTVLGSTGCFVGGVIWSWMYKRYESIWPGYVSHAIVDVAVFMVGWNLIFG